MNTACMQTRPGNRGGLQSATGLSRLETGSSLKGLYATATEYVGRWTAGFARAQRRRAALRELSRLSDRQLTDIGLRRTQLREVVDAMLRADGLRSDRADA